MGEEQIKVFIHGVANYFKSISGKDVEVGSPYLVDETIDIGGHYTGVIDISGEYKGVCYFSAPKELLSEIIFSVGETDTSNGMMLDTVGEVANILSGSAQSELGRGFIISTPRVYQGKASAQSFAEIDTYAIPILWQSHRGHICVAVN